MTELNDHLKLLFARAAQLFDRQTAQRVRHDTPETIYAELMARTAGGRPAPGRHLPGRAAGRHQRRARSSSGCRPAASRACRPSARSRRRPGRARCSTSSPTASASRAPRRCARSRRSRRRSSAAAAASTSTRCRRRGPAARASWRFSTGLHCPDSDLRYADPQPSLFSFNSAFGACETCRGFGRVIGVDYGLVIPDDEQDAARRRHQDDPDAGLEGVPGRPDAVRRRGRHPARHALGAAHRRAARLGDRRLAELERQVEQAVVRHQALLRVPGEQGLQDAHPRAAVEVPQLHAVPGLRRRAAEDRGAAVAPRHASEDADAVLPPGEALPAGRRRLDARAARSAAGPDAARPDAAADRPPARASSTASTLPTHAARRCAQAAARRDPHPPEVPVRRRHRLPDARPAEPHAVGRRGAAHQPDHRARHLAGQHAVRARRAVASACTRAT